LQYSTVFSVSISKRSIAQLDWGERALLCFIFRQYMFDLRFCDFVFLQHNNPARCLRYCLLLVRARGRAQNDTIFQQSQHPVQLRDVWRVVVETFGGWLSKPLAGATGRKQFHARSFLPGGSSLRLTKSPVQHRPCSESSASASYKATFTRQVPQKMLCYFSFTRGTFSITTRPLYSHTTLLFSCFSR
jgi:hypothetical protein